MRPSRVAELESENRELRHYADRLLAQLLKHDPDGNFLLMQDDLVAEAGPQ